MKQNNCMNDTTLNHCRGDSLGNRLSINMLVSIALLPPMLTLLSATQGCKQHNDRNNSNTAKEAVSFEDIHVRHLNPEDWGRELERFEQMTDVKGAAERPYTILRHIIERVPLQEVRTHLQKLSQNVSREERPDIFILLDRLNEMRNLDDAGLSRFIEKAQKDGDAERLTVAVFGLGSEAEQAKAAEALASIGKPESVRVLTIRLFRASAGYKGGTEDRISREQLRQSLVKALGSSTGLDFSGYDPSSIPETLGVVKRSQDWLDKNEPKGN